MKNLWQWLIESMGLSPYKDENNRRIKRSILNFTLEHSIDWRTWEIHRIQTVTKESEVIVTITLGRPGLLIGKGGIILDSLEKDLSNFINKLVKIKIVEFDVWR